MPEKVDPASKQSLEAFDEMIGLLETLRRDVSDAWELVEANPGNQFHRRALTHHVWAMIEGVTLGFKQWLLVLCDLGNEQLLLGERKFLTEREFICEPSGEIREQPVRQSTLNNLKKVYKLFSKKIPASWKPQFSGEDWPLLIESLNIRHRITHPKRVVELDISDDELEAIKGAVRWILANFNGFAVDGRPTPAKAA